MTNEELVKKGESPEKPKARKRPEQAPILAPGEASAFTAYNLRLFQLPDVDKTDLDAVNNRVSEYFRICVECDMKPTVESFCLAIGEDRNIFLRRLKEGYYSDEVTRTLEKVYLALNSLMADYMYNGKINPVSGIFLMKNNMGYSDKSEIYVTPKSPFGDAPDRDELEKRYMDSMPIEAEYTVEE